MTYLSYIFLLYGPIFTITGDNKEENIFFKYFWKILQKFEKKILQIHKHSCLSITRTLKKLNFIQTFLEGIP